MRFMDDILRLTNKAGYKFATIFMGALMACILPVAAQLDEIVVTAERQEANLQDDWLLGVQP